MKRFLIAIVVVVVIINIVFIYRTPMTTTTFPMELDLPESRRISPWYLEPPVTDVDVQCLALNIYFEARSDTVEGRYAVADVVMFRAMHHDFPDTVCGVVKAGVYPAWAPDMPIKWRCAFTWYCDRKEDVPYDTEAFSIAQHIARDVLFNPDYEPEIYALYYHADYVDPKWPHTFVGKIGKHLFYM
jgi:spore germination cell wall hydrolase CwlJ-like protein